eukprot:EC719539.1.p2 GENE.EC719539.1~~EC719539.1.p2  ORF type:complete len:119 (+),score=6.81 EC719539.1:107-463(+)
MQIASPRAPSLIEYQDWRFLIIDSPTEATLSEAVKVLQKFHVKHIVQVCVERFYSDEPLHQVGIETHEFSFPDGESPPTAVIEKWLKLVHDVFVKKRGRVPMTRLQCIASLAWGVRLC